MLSVFIEPCKQEIFSGLKKTSVGNLIELPVMPRPGDHIEVMAASVDLAESIELEQSSQSIYTVEMLVKKVVLPESKSPTKTIPGLGGRVNCTVTRIFSMNDVIYDRKKNEHDAELQEHRKEEAEIGNI